MGIAVKLLSREERARMLELLEEIESLERTVALQRATADSATGGIPDDSTTDKLDECIKAYQSYAART